MRRLFAEDEALLIQTTWVWLGVGGTARGGWGSCPTHLPWLLTPGLWHSQCKMQQLGSAQQCSHNGGGGICLVRSLGRGEVSSSVFPPLLSTLHLADLIF